MLEAIAITLSLALAVVGPTLIAYGVWRMVKPWWTWAEGDDDFCGRERK